MYYQPCNMSKSSHIIIKKTVSGKIIFLHQHTDAYPKWVIAHRPDLQRTRQFRLESAGGSGECHVLEWLVDLKMWARCPNWAYSVCQNTQSTAY